MALPQTKPTADTESIRPANTNKPPRTGNVRVIGRKTATPTTDTNRRIRSASAFYTDESPKTPYPTISGEFKNRNYNRPNSTLVSSNDNRSELSTQSNNVQNASAEYIARQNTTNAEQVQLQKQLQLQRQHETDIETKGDSETTLIDRTKGLKAASQVAAWTFNVWMIILLPIGLLNLATAAALEAAPTFVQKAIDIVTTPLTWLGFTVTDTQAFFVISWSVQFFALLIVIIGAAGNLHARGIKPIQGKDGHGLKEFVFIVTIAVGFIPGWGIILPLFMVWIFVAGLFPN